jgi:predicted transcriptional regulator
MKQREPSKLEMQVLSVLWRRGPSTVRDVLEAMPDGKTRAYTTILTVMQVMEKKGLVGHTTQGNAHLYEAQVSRARAIGPMLRGLVRDVFGGSAVAAMQQLLAENEVSREELQEIKRLIAEQDRKEAEKPASATKDGLKKGES